MACFEPYQLFGTIITWLLISRSGYRRANLLFDAHNVAPPPRATPAPVDEDPIVPVRHVDVARRRDPVVGGYLRSCVVG